MAATQEQIQQCRQVFARALKRAGQSDCMLLSGGLDTCLLAEYSQELGDMLGLKAGVTVKACDEATDYAYAEKIAKKCNLKYHLVETTLEQLLEEMEFCVKVFKSFDPMQLRNNVVIARAMMEAKRLGYESVCTGDGADELFGGYSFMIKMESPDFEKYSDHMANVMSFSAGPLAKELGLKLSQPFLDPEVIEFSRTLNRAVKVGIHDDFQHGKFILRQAFPDMVSVWRVKEPIEVGSGSTTLPQYLQERIDPEDLARQQKEILEQDRINIRDAEHLAYYRIFKRVFGDQCPTPRFQDDPCIQCGYQIASKDKNFCYTCGQWPARSSTSQ
ncbi:adenine nucleotide alpha hydrolases-like protein [Basidiobolus meristosporus CBS 931.73]|uniref:Adenine nucleotide alpha hydrolases-like protein n=1 Tax=Basidiobolus meristosporus CBS 931.73 TaxID=1314790 RepID=A0A1Y1Y8J6_9FUNG|nr:adenine nucleotide alpha hydrolases-like protein [Basidiobolus meristosporus CBS 931.73]|eukprot:ORX93894.1 adenine nucleotide alpha hydrolases-like protein [Basidiobolus meristosporus CBS 931.73]